MRCLLLSSLFLSALLAGPFPASATQIFVVSGTSQTSPADWDNSNNNVQALGGGASGALGDGSFASSGGGGGEWRKISNFSVATPGTTTFTYTIGTGGTGVSGTAAAIGNDGVQTTFNTATLIAKPGSHGLTGNAVAGAGGTGGTGAAGNFNGGAGGNTGTSKFAASGGGGAAGSTGVGNPGTTLTVANTGTAGGSADNGGTGAGTSGAASNSAAGGTNTATAGGAGTEWDASHGSGGGGGGAVNTSTGTPVGGAGGLYGGGGGGSDNESNGTTMVSGAGKDGIVVITYTPLASGSGPKLPLLGVGSADPSTIIIIDRMTDHVHFVAMLDYEYQLYDPAYRPAFGEDRIVMTQGDYRTAFALPNGLPNLPAIEAIFHGASL